MKMMTNGEIEDKIERLKFQKENLTVSLPFSVVEKNIRAKGVFYKKIDSFLLSDLLLYNVESNYSANEMTMFKSGQGLKLITLSYSQYVVVQKLLNQKKKECSGLDLEMDRLLDLLPENETENE